MDSTNPTLIDGQTSQGTATIAGNAWLVINLPGTGSGYGKFTVDGNLNFSGTYNPMIAGNTPGTCDTLYVDQSMNVQPGSYLQAAVNGTPIPGTWTIIITGGNNINKFSGNNDSATGLHDTNNQPEDGDYQLSF